MSAITIYTKTGEKRYDAPITQDAQHVHELMKEHYVQLVFNAPLIEFSMGDYVIYEQVKYTLQEIPKPTRNGTAWKYDIQFHSFEANWKNCVFFFIPETGAKESEWALTARPADFMAMAIRNINRFMGTDYETGVILTAETKSITFTNVSVWDALSQIAEAFDTEWWFDGEFLHLNKFEYGSGQLLDLDREIKSISGNKGDQTGYSTRIYPYGSTRNIIPEAISTATNSILNNRLKLAELEYVDSRANLTKEEIVEAVVIFEDIYPRMKDKKISSVRVDEQTIDDTKQNVYYFKISNLGFDPKPLILDGMNLSVKFESGNLNGREFELNWHSSTEEFEILNVSESGALIIPNASLCPAVGDAVVLFNLKMPDSYKTDAQAELLTAAQEYIIESSKDRTVYTVETNPVYCFNNDIDLNIGQRVRLADTTGKGTVNLLPYSIPVKLGSTSNYRDSRIRRFEKKLYNKYICTYQVGDNATYSRIGNIEREAREAKYAVTGAISNGGSSIPVITRYDVSKPTDLNVYSALRSREEFAKRKESDTIKEQWKFEKGVRIGTDIVPGLLGGSIDQDANAELKSLTLREFLNVPELRYNRVSVIAGEQWSAPGGGIIEGVNESNNRFKLKLESGELPALQVFDLCKGIFNTGTGFATAYFRIENIAKSGDDYIVLYSLKPGTTLHPQPFMHFVAYGNVFDTSRQASAVHTREYLRFMADVNTWDISASMIRAHIGNMSGMTINGVDFSGYSGLLRNFYFDGTLAQLAPAIADSEQNTKDYVDEKTAAENLALQNFIDNTYTQEMLAMQAQMDGQVESFFFQQDPTLNNAPANGWNTAAIKESHLNDTYTNLSTGKSWRWSKDGTTYSWVAIADTATEKALMIAGQAKDTADSKRRTFIVTPYPPYDAGDLWINTGDDLMKCIYARASGSYVASDWTKATKYTDDSAVNNMQIGGRNLVLNSMSKPVDGYWSFNGWTAFPVQFDNGLAFKTVSGWGLYTCDIGVSEGSVCVSFEIKCIEEKDSSGNTTSTLRGVRLVNGNTYDAAMEGVYIPISWDWQKHTFVLNVSNPNVGFFMQLLREGTNDSAAISVRNLKIERGNKPTDWSPAPEDIESGIDDAKNTGAAYNSMGEYSSATYYTGSRYQRDVVWIDNSAMATGREYFVAKITAGTFVNVTTSDKNKWESIGAQFSSIATDFLLARKIQGEEIDTDTLIVKSLQTSKDVNADQRIVIDHNTNSMVMSKSGKDVLIISGKKVVKLEDQLNEIGGLVIPIQKSGELKNVERIGYMPNVETNIHGLTVFTYHVPVGFVCKVPPMKLTIDASLGGYLGGGMHEQARTESCISMYVNDELVYSNILRLVIAPSSLMDSNKKEFTTPEMIITAPGDYNIKITLQTQVTGYFEYMTSYAKSSAKGYLSNINANDNILVYAISELTELFSNGMMSKYSTTKYMAVINTDTDPVWIARDGNYGLQVCKDGVKIMRNGVDWANL